jgi:hypothetical protein
VAAAVAGVAARPTRGAAAGRLTHEWVVVVAARLTREPAVAM